jgi:glyoxylase I family protein
MLASPRDPTEVTLGALDFRDFSHITVRVSDMERSLAFYRDGLGLRVIFDVKLEGAGLEAVTGSKGSKGRMVGLIVPGAGRVSIELLGFDHPKSERPPQGRFTGYSNISLSVDDLDAAHAECVARGLRPLQKPVDVGGVRMFFLADPDGTAIELIEFPHGATTSADFNNA